MITIYSKTQCPHCVNAKNYLTANGIEYTEINIERDAGAREFVLSEGHRSVPQLYVGTQQLISGGWAGLSQLKKEQILEAVAAIEATKLKESAYGSH